MLPLHFTSTVVKPEKHALNTPRLGGAGGNSEFGEDTSDIPGGIGTTPSIMDGMADGCGSVRGSRLGCDAVVEGDDSGGNVAT